MIKSGSGNNVLDSKTNELVPVFDGLASFTLDTSGKIISWNIHSENLLGYSEKEILNKNVQRLYDEEDATAIKSFFQHNSSDLELVFEGVLYNGMKEEIWCKSGFRKLMDAEGVLIGFFCMIRDKTDLHILQEKLDHLSGRLEAADKKVADQFAYIRDLESFNSILVHDLRAPLRAVIGYAEILIEDFGSELSEEGQRILSAIGQNSNDASKLMDCLLVYNKISKMPVHKEDVNIELLIDSIMHNHLVDTGHKVEYNLEKLPHIFADPELMKMLFEEIIDNAIKYNQSATKKIEIHAEKKNNKVVYSLTDNGIGFDMKYHDKIYIMFQRLEVRGYDGYGVGLAKAKKIVEKHQGSILAESSPGDGTTMKIILPIK